MSKLLNRVALLYQGHRKRLQRMWRQMPFAGSSPFHHSRGHDSGFVLAFEVEWGSICGLDYSNPLCQDGRVVVEAKHVTKREFQTVCVHLSDASIVQHK